MCGLADISNTLCAAGNVPCTRREQCWLVNAWLARALDLSILGTFLCEFEALLTPEALQRHCLQRTALDHVASMRIPLLPCCAFLNHDNPVKGIHRFLPSFLISSINSKSVCDQSVPDPLYFVSPSEEQNPRRAPHI